MDTSFAFVTVDSLTTREMLNLGVQSDRQFSDTGNVKPGGAI